MWFWHGYFKTQSSFFEITQLFCLDLTLYKSSLMVVNPYSTFSIYLISLEIACYSLANF